VLVPTAVVDNLAKDEEAAVQVEVADNHRGSAFAVVDNRPEIARECVKHLAAVAHYVVDC